MKRHLKIRILSFFSFVYYLKTRNCKKIYFIQNERLLNEITISDEIVIEKEKKF